MMKYSVVAVAGMCAAAGCGEYLVAPVAQRIATDSSSYTAVPIGNGEVEFRVITRFTNTTNATATLERCTPSSTSPVYGVGLVSPPGPGSGGSAYSVDWACVGGVSPFTVAPGGTRVDTLFLRGPTSLPTPPNNLEGTFQIVMSGVVSNTFTVKLSPSGVVPVVQRDAAAVIQTDSLVVHLHRVGFLYTSTTPIVVRIANPRNDTSYVVNCSGATSVLYEKQVGADWVPAFAPNLAGCLSPPIVIPPGGFANMSLIIEGVDPGHNAAPEFAVADIPGVYRITFGQIVSHYTTKPGSAFGPLIPVEYRRSNAFALVVDP